MVGGLEIHVLQCGFPKGAKEDQAKEIGIDIDVFAVIPSSKGIVGVQQGVAHRHGGLGLSGEESVPDKLFCGSGQLGEILLGRERC